MPLRQIFLFLRNNSLEVEKLQTDMVHPLNALLLPRHSYEEQVRKQWGDFIVYIVILPLLIYHCFH